MLLCETDLLDLLYEMLVAHGPEAAVRIWTHKQMQHGRQ